MTEIFRNRLIGFFDVLGFSSRLEQGDISNLHREYSAFIDAADREIFNGENLVPTGEGTVKNFEKTQFLFDSLVLISNETSNPIEVCNFILAANSLVGKAFANGFFLRGNIALGDILFDDDRNIFLSQIFPKLLKEEKDQEWCGCTIDPAAESLIIESVFGPLKRDSFVNLSRTSPLLQYVVPRKGNCDSKASWCLNWVGLASEIDIKNGIGKMIDPKKSNTKDFVNWVRGLPSERIVFSEGALPVAYCEVMKTRGGFILAFFDSYGHPIDPPNGFEFSVLQQSNHSP